MNMNAVFHVAIEGNIAAGKTTLIKNLKSTIEKHHKMAVEIMLEPVETWTCFGSHQVNYLGLAYSNPAIYSHRFQMMATATKLSQYLSTQKTIERKMNLNVGQRVTILLVERSIETQLKVFLKVLEDQRKISTEDAAMIEFLQVTLLELKGLDPDFSVYLKTSPQTALQRLQCRNRQEEDKVKLQDLALLEEKHRDWLLSPRFRNLLTIDADDIASLDVKELAQELVLRATTKVAPEQVN